MICVTLNHRLGAEGFLLLEGTQANRGLLDVLAALRWVAANIAAFGDPVRVVLGGQSAGAMAVAALLTAPAAEELFCAAVLASGGADNVLSREQGRATAAHAAGELGVKATRDGFAAVPADRLGA